MSYDVGEVMEGLENEAEPYIASHMPQLILQPFSRFTYVIAHSPNLPSLHLRHSSFYNPSVASPTSQLILQTFLRFTYVTVHSTTFPLLHLRHRHFTYVTWRAAHVILLQNICNDGFIERSESFTT